MSTNDGGPAFPVSTMVEERTAGYGHQDGPATYQFGGMTLRDYFAAKAMAAMIGTAAIPCLVGLKGGEPQTAEAAYKIADAMLKAREAA